jgi:hypothetical protein
MVKIEIETSDKSLLTDLLSENIPDLSISWRKHTCDSTDWITFATTAIIVIVSTTSSVALSLFSSWLYDHIIKKKPDKTTINDKDIVKSPEQIFVIFGDYIQINQNTQKDKK